MKEKDGVLRIKVNLTSIYNFRLSSLGEFHNFLMYNNFSAPN